jgi:hypothetical protein
MLERGLNSSQSDGAGVNTFTDEFEAKPTDHVAENLIESLRYKFSSRLSLFMSAGFFRGSASLYQQLYNSSGIY